MLTPAVDRNRGSRLDRAAAGTPGSVVRRLEGLQVHSAVKPGLPGDAAAAAAQPPGGRAGGGPTALERAVAALPGALVVEAARRLRAAGGEEAAEGGGDATVQLRLVPDGRVGAKGAGAAGGGAAGKKAAAAAAVAAASRAREEVVARVREAVDCLARWRLGVLVAHRVAQFTGAAVRRPEFSLAGIYLAASSKGFHKLMGR